MLIKLRKMIKREENQKGFTLVELIIVMAILAILAALAVPKFGTVLSKTKDKARAQNHELIESSADLYVSSETRTDAQYKTDLDGTINDSHTLVSGSYLKKTPLDPITNGNYTLTVTVSNGNITSSTVSP